MGHAFNQTIMDALTRYHRMLGFNTLWLPGTDHAGIATQIVVERQLEAKRYRSARDGPREVRRGSLEVAARIRATAILQQMRRLGDSVDWSRTYFTMDESLSQVVVETFVRLYEQGLIYRGKRLVNWDPKLQTAVADLEVETEEEDGTHLGDSLSGRRRRRIDSSSRRRGPKRCWATSRSPFIRATNAIAPGGQVS